MVTELFNTIADQAGVKKIYRCKNCNKLGTEFNYEDGKCDTCHNHKVCRCKKCGIKFHVGVDGWGGLAKCNECKELKDRMLALWKPSEKTFAQYEADYDTERDREVCEAPDEEPDPCPL